MSATSSTTTFCTYMKYTTGTSDIADLEVIPNETLLTDPKGINGRRVIITVALLMSLVGVALVISSSAALMATALISSTHDGFDHITELLSR